MAKFRLVLVALCFGSLGACAQQATPVQRQAALQQQSADNPNTVRAEVGAPLAQALELAKAGEYKEAIAVVDGLEGVPNKTAFEVRVIDQMRQYLFVKAPGLSDQ